MEHPQEVYLRTEAPKAKVHTMWKELANKPRSHWRDRAQPTLDETPQPLVPPLPLVQPGDDTLPTTP